MYTTFLASIFRSLRFGIDEAHGRGVAIQLNHFLDAGAVQATGDGRFTARPEKMPAAVESLTREIMTIQAEGSYGRAAELLERLAVIRPETARVLQSLSDVPVDIEPHYAASTVT